MPNTSTQTDATVDVVQRLQGEFTEMHDKYLAACKRIREFEELPALVATNLCVQGLMFDECPYDHIGHVCRSEYQAILATEFVKVCGHKKRKRENDDN